MREYIISESEVPVNLSGNGLYDKYLMEGHKLYKQSKDFGEKFTQSAFDLYNDMVLSDGNIPDIDDVIYTIHADEIFEAHGKIVFH